MCVRKFTDEQEQEICRRYEAGEMTTALSKELGVTSKTISNILRRCGVQARLLSVTDEQKLVDLANAGHRVSEIARLLGVSRQAVSRRLNSIGYLLQPHQRHPRRSNLTKEEQRIRDRQYAKKWNKDNLDKAREYRRKIRKKKKATNLEFKLKTRLRARMYVALKGNSKLARTHELLGCSVAEVRAHLESQFRPGMTWDNWAHDGWHVDHIRPCASFDLTDPEQQKQCFHYTNLQPLWAEENHAKSDRWVAA